MKYLLGIDLGTSSVKSLLLDKNGKIKGITQESYNIDIPAPGCAEQNPEMWWAKTCITIKKLLAGTNINSKDIDGIGFSGQMHGIVALDEAYIPIRPCIIWADQRTKSEVDYIYSTIGRETLAQMTLNPIATGFFGASLLWLKRNEPATYSKIHKVILPKDYIRYKMTGKIASEITDASSTLLFDTANLKWNQKLVEMLELNPEVLPECFTPYTLAGYVTSACASETGLFEGTPIVFGAGDQPSQALGNGITKPGIVSVTIGTGGQVFTPVNSPIYDSKLRTHTFCHVVPNTWNIMGATLSAGLSMKWLKDKILNTNSFDEMTQLAEKVPPGSEGLIFLPYLTGERTPHMDSLAKGMFFGLTLKHSKSAMIRAVMEGVVFSLKDCMDIFTDMELKMDRIISSGGGAKSKIWKQIMADVLGFDVYTSSVIEQASMGAAMLAGLGTGWFSSVEESTNKLVSLQEEIIKPNPANHEIYMKNFELYKNLYTSTRHLSN